MDTFEFDSDAFYICTEVSPRNFVVQKAIQIDKNQIERMVGKFDGKTSVEKASTSPDSSVGTSSAHSPGTSSSTSASGVNGIPQPPPLPYWFNRECKSTLMMYGPQPNGAMNVQTIPSSSNQFIPGPRFMTRDDMKQQLKNQLEYYFSRENLISDRFLKCQMDEEQFVPINVVAAFPKIAKLTNDIDMIVEALKESANVELDENMEKVRAITRRTTIIVREIPEDSREVIEKLLKDGPKFTELTYAFNDSWYVTYKDELDTQCAYISVQNKINEVTQRPVCVRMRAGGAPAISSATDVSSNESCRLPATNNGEKGTIQIADPGQTLGLGEIGLIPIATYRPGEPIMSHYVTPTCQFSVNSYGYNTPIQVQSPPPPLLQQQLYYSSSNVSSQNFDAMSTTSSNSTRTSASNYNTRNNSNRNGSGTGNHTNNYYEQRNSFSNSNDWRSRNGSFGSGRFQNNQNQNENYNRPNNSGNWKNGVRNGSNQNGFNQRNNRQNGHQSNWRNEQNGRISSNSWLTSEVPSIHTRISYDHGYNNRRREQISPSSSSSTSSKQHSLDTFLTQDTSESSTSPPLTTSEKNSEYSVPTPTDLPPPPVWPAPNFDRRRKSSEASSTTVTTNTSTNTLTPSTPVISSDTKSVFIQETTKMVHEMSVNEKPITKKEETVQNGHKIPQTIPKVETKVSPIVEKEKIKSPPVAPIVAPPVVVPTPSFAFEETAFPSLPKKIEPVKPPQKPTFSSVAASRLVKQIRQMPPEKKLSYAEKLKKADSLFRK